MTTLQVTEDGQTSRSFRFLEQHITIGANPACLLRLDSTTPTDPGIATIHVVPGAVPHVQASPADNGFRLNGRPCGADAQPLRPGDSLTTDRHRVLVKSLPTNCLRSPDSPPKPAGAMPVVDDDATHVAATQATAVSPLAAAGVPTIPTIPTTSSRPADSDPHTEGATEATAAFAAEEEPTAVHLPLDAPTSSPPTSEPPAPAIPAAIPAAATPIGHAARAPEGLAYLYLFFGPVRSFLEDDEVSEVMINGPRQVYIERKGRLQATDAKFPSEQALQAAIINVARSVGRFFNHENPRLDARLPDGSRVHAVMPPLSRAGAAVAIRKFRRDRLTMAQLVQFGSISTDVARLLEIIVRLGKNLVVSGATSSGKTSVLNVLSALIPSDQRILVLEDASELQLQQTHVLGFETRKADEYGRGEVTIRDLLHSSLRLRPDRIVVGEIRGGEALDLLQAMNTGHDGSMSTIHANSARDSLFRLETCALFSGVELPLAALREQVASAVHVVVQTARLIDGTRKIVGVTEVLGIRDGQYHLEDIAVYQHPTGDGPGRHRFTGYVPTFAGAAERQGHPLTELIRTAAS